MITEYSSNFGVKDKNVLYMECFGKLMDGISPWLALPEDDTKEGKIRKKLHEWALLSYKNAVMKIVQIFLYRKKQILFNL